MASFSVYRAEFRDGSVEMWSQKETIASGPCTPPPTLETLSKKISSLANSFQYRDSGFTEEEADDEYDDRDS